jgi:hypothetical protein
MASETRWAIAPEIGKTHLAVFETKEAIGFEGGTTLTFTLEQSSDGADWPRAFREHDSAANPRRAAARKHQPGSCAGCRSTQEAQKSEAAYYRTISPELSRIKDKVAGRENPRRNC